MSDVLGPRAWWKRFDIQVRAYNLATKPHEVARTTPLLPSIPWPCPNTYSRLDHTDMVIMFYWQLCQCIMPSQCTNRLL